MVAGSEGVPYQIIVDRKLCSFMPGRTAKVKSLYDCAANRFLVFTLPLYTREDLKTFKKSRD